MSSEAISSASAAQAQSSQAADRSQAQSQAQATQQIAEARSLERVQKAQDAEAAKEAKEAPTLDELESAVTQINSLLKEGQRSVAFNLDRDSGQVVVKVTNTQTDEVIRQIPNEDALRFAKNLEGMMGMIFNEKA